MVSTELATHTAQKSRIVEFLPDFHLTELPWLQSKLTTTHRPRRGSGLPYRSW